MEASNKPLNEKVLEFIEKQKGRLHKAAFELVQEAKRTFSTVESIEEVLDLEPPSSQKEYNITLKLQKAAKQIQERLEECTLLAMDDLDFYDFLDAGKLSQKKVETAAQKVFLYKDLGEEIEADLLEAEIRKICLGKGIKEGSLNKIFKKGAKKEKAEKDLLSTLEVYGYDDQRQVWIGFRGYIEIVSHASLKTQLPIILGPDIDVKEVIALIQSKAHKNGRLCQKRTLGQGIHFIKEKWVLVSGKTALSIDPKTFERKEVCSPIFEEDYLIDLNGREWINLDLIHPKDAPENCLETSFKELHQSISKWEWRHKEAALHVTAFTMLTLFQQAINPWRPIIYLSGAQGTGKTMFSTFLDHVFHGFLEILDKTTAHAIKQTFGNNSTPGFFDEFEHYESEKRQKDILNLLKTSCRGGKASFGTTGKSARECYLNHLFWIASISFPRCIETDSALRDRMIVFDLKKKSQKFLKMPPSKELNLLGVNLINALIKNWEQLETKVQEKMQGDTKEENVEARQIENFVWASSLIDLTRKIEPLHKASAIVPKWSIRKKEDDADRIIEEILHTKVKNNLYEHFIADLIYRAMWNFEDIDSDNRKDVSEGSAEAINLLRLNHLTITKKDDGALYLGIHATKLSTFFEKKEMFSGIDIRTILGRLDFVQTGKVKFGCSGLTAILIPIKEIDRILGRRDASPKTPAFNKADYIEKEEEFSF